MVVLARPRPAPVVLRRATLFDLEALIAIEESSFTSNRLSRRSLRGFLTGSTATVIGATLDERAVGMAVVLFRRLSTAARLYSIAVLPEHRRHGIGGRLLQHAEECAVERGCRAMRLEVSETNPDAIAAYRKHGYRQFDFRHDYYQDGANALRFERRLVVP